MHILSGRLWERAVTHSGNSIRLFLSGPAFFRFPFRLSPGQIPVLNGFCVLVTELLLAGALCFFLAHLVWIVAAPLPLPAGKVTFPSPPAQAPPASGSGGNPFVTMSADPVPVPETGEDFKETDLDLVLAGTSVWGKGSAIIRTPDGEQKRYGVGDTVVQGVFLAAVDPQQAVIERNGMRESLRFESKPDPDALVSYDPEPVRAGEMEMDDGALSAVERPAPWEHHPVNGVDETVFVTPLVRFGKSIENGQVMLKLYAGQDRRTFAGTGLQNGDRLVSVNGMEVLSGDGMEVIRSLFDSLTGQGTLSIVLERDGERVELDMREADLLWG